MAINQQAAQFGTSRVAVEILRPDSAVPGGFEVIAKSETESRLASSQTGHEHPGPQDRPVEYGFCGDLQCRERGIGADAGSGAPALWCHPAFRLSAVHPRQP